MKTLLLITITIATILLTCHNAVSQQVPQKMNYQGVARNSSGTLLTNRTIGLRFSIHETSAAGPEVYSETTSAITNNYGTFTAEIGGGTPIFGSFATISWGTGAKYLQIQMDPNGGISYTDMGTYPILSAAYAQYAKNVLNNDDDDANPSNELQTLSIVGDQLSISNGNTVTLPGGGSSTTPGGVTGNIQFNNAGAFAGDNALFWDNTNKSMGIGITTPTYKLHLDGGSSFTGNRLHMTNTTTGATSGDGFVVGGSTSSASDLILWNFEDGRIRFGANGELKMNLTSAGNLMLGSSTDEPAGAMEIARNTNTGFPHLLLTESDDDYARLMFKNNVTTTKNWTIAGKCNPSDANSRLNFWYYNGTSGTDILSVTGDGKLLHYKTGTAHTLPIAYGFINASGAVATGTSNISCSWNASSSRYEITITGVSYLYNEFITLVTPSSSSSAVIATTSSVSGNLLVYCRNASGTAIQNSFQFVVYRP